MQSLNSTLLCPRILINSGQVHLKKFEQLNKYILHKTIFKIIQKVVQGLKPVLFWWDE